MSTVVALDAFPAARQPAATMAHVDYLDGWRGVAIALVLQEHFLTIRGFESGTLGVDIFFCLSGLLISHILFVQRIPLTTFYKRRISRILPVFCLFIALVYGVGAATGRGATWTEIVATATFLRTYLPVAPDIWSTNLPIGHLWSLNVEEHGYIVLSAVALLTAARHRSGALLMLLGTAMVGIHLAYYRHALPAPVHFEIRTETAAAYLLLSAGYFLVRDRFAPHVRPWMPVAAFLVAVPCYAGALPESVELILTPFLLAFAVNHIGQARPGVLSMLSAAPLRRLGICSYSIYLWQQPFYQFKASFPPFTALVGALLVGAISFHVLENPVRTWLNRNW